MSRYVILIEPTDTGFSAYSPDLPGAYRPVAPPPRSRPICARQSKGTSRSSGWLDCRFLDPQRTRAK
jgi:hypothetical protein